MARANEIHAKIYREMDEFYKQEKHPSLLKSHIHTLIAENFEPKIFSESPFFFEMSLRDRFSWGMGPLTPSSWLANRLSKTVDSEHPLAKFLELQSGIYFQNQFGICRIHSPFDRDHHTLGYTTLFAEGIDGILAKIRSAVNEVSDKDKLAFLKAAEESWLSETVNSEASTPAKTSLNVNSQNR